MLLQYLECFLDQIRQVLVFPLSVVYFVSDVHYITQSLRLLFLNMLNTGSI